MSVADPLPSRPGPHSDEAASPHTGQFLYWVVMLWGVGGVLALFGRALYRLTPYAWEPIREGSLSWGLIAAYVGWVVFNAYGEGYRSPQARTLEDGEQAPFTKVRSADLGFELSQDDSWSVRLGGYWTSLSDDVVFDAREGRLERVGESRRLGAMFYATARPLPW